MDKLTGVFGYRVGVARDLERGDSLRVLVERQIDPAGTPHDGRIVAALTVGGELVDAVRYHTGAAVGAAAGG